MELAASVIDSGQAMGKLDELVTGNR